MLKMECQEKEVRLDFSGEKLSTLIVGGSRMGKTYFASLLGAFLIQKNVIHLIDLGNKWSNSDKGRINIPTVYSYSEKEPIQIYFPSKISLLGSAKYITNALGYRSKALLRVLRSAMEQLLKLERIGFSVAELICVLEEEAKSDSDAKKIFDELDCLNKIPQVELIVDVRKSEEIANTSILWNLSGYEEEYVNILVQLIVSSLLEIQKFEFEKEQLKRNVFIFIDEFQNLNCTRQSVIGKCLTEGQKYRLYLVLITQYLQGNFSETVVNQLKQGGFQIYFRLTEEEASIVSNRLSYDALSQKKLRNILCTLKRGEFLLKGAHYIGISRNVTESIRIVDVKDTCASIP